MTRSRRRRPRRGVTPDGLGRLGDPRRAGRDRVLRLLIAVMLYIWMERKVIADMQTRIGPMRAGPRGVLITLADGIKLFFKEGITPTTADRPVYAIAPVLAIFPGSSRSP